MMFKRGDKVKFLNEKGGGIVTEIISPGLVKVAIEDGFEIPTMVSELVKVEDKEIGSRFFTEHFEASTRKTPEPDDPGYSDIPKFQPILRREQIKPSSSGIYMAFVPHNQKWLITGLLDIYIINHSPYTILYNYFLAETDGLYSGMDYDTVEPETMVYLQTIDRNELSSWNQGILQVLFHHQEPDKVVLPASTSFDIRETRFLKEDNYTESSMLMGRSLMVCLIELSKQGKITARYRDLKTGSHEPIVKSTSHYREPALIDQFRNGENQAEVDLHIEELLETTAGLDPESILKIQLDHFTRCLESAIEHHYHKVIFIHGVGNGTLKSELKMLLDRYEGLKYSMAPMAKYGVGAIEVQILHA